MRATTLVLLLASLALAACDDPPPDETTSTEGEGEDETITVELCDNHTTVEVPADQPATRESGQRISDALMAQWFERNPDAKWGEDEPAHAIVPPADNSGVLAETEERVETGWPPGPREEAVRRRDEAEATLGEIDAAIASQEASLADLDARAARLRQEIAAWSALLEAELGAAVPPLEETAEGEAPQPAEGETPEAGAPEP